MNTAQIDRTLTLLACVVAINGCGPEPFSTTNMTLCQQATNHARQCFSIIPPWNDSDCDPAAAEQVLRMPCDEPPVQAVSFTTQGGWRNWWCDRFGWFCPPPGLHKPPIGDVTRFPILYVHGLRSSAPAIGAENHPLFRRLRKRPGQVLRIAALPPFTGLANMVPHLADEVDALLTQTGARMVNLIAHSYGGLVSRALVDKGYGDRIASITTLGTPHQGTPVANATLRASYAAPSKAIDMVARWIGTTYSTASLAREADVRQALSDLSADNVLRAANDPRVYYQSWAGLSNAFPTMADNELTPEEHRACGGRILWNEGWRDRMRSAYLPLVAFLDGLPSDGVVPVISAAHGLFRGCVAADHADLFPWADESGTNHTTGYDVTLFHLNIVDDLAEMGF